MSDGSVKENRHAEAHALQLAERSGGRIKKVYVMRMTKSGKLTMAKPCKDCQARLWLAGVRARDVQYTNWEGSFEGMV